MKKIDSIIKNKNIVYVGSHYPPKIKEHLLEIHSGVDFPADNLQQSILKGFDANGLCPKAITYLNITPWPKIKLCRIKPCKFSRREDDNLTDKYIGGINIPFLSRLYNAISLALGLRKLSSRNDKNDLVVYSLSSLVLFAVWCTRNRFGIKTVIVPDLPEFMSDKKGRFRSMAKTIDHCLIKFFINKSIDKFVLLSPHMVERLPIDGKPWMQMEGIFSDEGFKYSYEKNSERIILYTGKLGRRYGIIDLLDAFSSIKDTNFRLWIRGDGECKQEVLDRAQKDLRIKYFGRMSREEILKLEAKATVLVNPVKPSQEFTRYFFPSKTMEYLASGTPTIMYHLACLPHEYLNHIFIIKEESVESLSKTLKEVCSLSQEELHEFGKRAANFIVNEKTPTLQIKKVMEFISK